MSTTYFINKFNLLNSLKFPTQQYHKEYKVFQCNERMWVVSEDRYVFHSYKEPVDGSIRDFSMIYVDTEDLDDYYDHYPNAKLKEY